MVPYRTKNSVHISELDLQNFHKCIKTDSHKSLKCHLKKTSHIYYLIVYLITSVTFTYHTPQEYIRTRQNFQLMWDIAKIQADSSVGLGHLNFINFFNWLFPSSLFFYSFLTFLLPSHFSFFFRLPFFLTSLKEYG